MQAQSPSLVHEINRHVLWYHEKCSPGESTTELRTTKADKGLSCWATFTGLEQCMTSCATLNKLASNMQPMTLNSKGSETWNPHLDTYVPHAQQYTCDCDSVDCHSLQDHDTHSLQEWSNQGCVQCLWSWCNSLLSCVWGLPSNLLMSPVESKGKNYCLVDNSFTPPST